MLQPSSTATPRALPLPSPPPKKKVLQVFLTPESPYRGDNANRLILHILFIVREGNMVTEKGKKYNEQRIIQVQKKEQTHGMLAFSSHQTHHHRKMGVKIGQLFFRLRFLVGIDLLFLEFFFVLLLFACLECC